MAEKAPGFAGIVLDSAGTATILLVDTTKLDEAILAAVEFPAVSLTNGRPRVRKVRYSFQEIRAWRERLYGGPLPRGLVLVDVDEQANRLRLGFATESDMNNARSVVAEAGIPLDGAILQVAPQYEVAQGGSIQGVVTPRVGAIQIGGPGFPSQCTMGFNAKRYSDPATYFVTNAHCTGLIGINQSTPFGQNLLQIPIGVEYVDPPYTQFAGCPVYLSQGCRYADAALIKYNPGIAVGLYRLAQTTFAYNGTDITQNGSFTMVPTKFEVTGEVPNFQLLYGAFVNKIGVTSGWTTGYVFASCVDQIMLPTQAILCQMDVHGVCRGGDSGSPVFVYDTGIPGTGYLAQIAGIVHSCGFDSFGTGVLRFSPIGGITADFGNNLKTFKWVN